jgi:hypothetical protein
MRILRPLAQRDTIKQKKKGATEMRGKPEVDDICQEVEGRKEGCVYEMDKDRAGPEIGWNCILHGKV